MFYVSQEQRGVMYAILSGLSFGLLGYFGITLMHANLSLHTMLVWRFIVSALVVTLALMSEYKSITLDHYENIKAFLAGMIFYSPTAIFYFIACKHIGTGLAMVTFFVYPVIVILINKVLYKTSIPRIYYPAVALIMSGLFLLSCSHEMTFNYTGIIFGIASAFTYSLYVIFSKKSPLSPLVSTLWVSLGCIVTCLLAALIEGTLSLPKNMTVWLNIVAVGTACTALPMLLLLKALRYITAEKAAILSVLEPVFVVLFGVLLLDETITLSQLIGIVIVLSGALLTLLVSKK